MFSCKQGIKTRCWLNPCSCWLRRSLIHIKLEFWLTLRLWCGNCSHSFGWCCIAPLNVLGAHSNAIASLRCVYIHLSISAFRLNASIALIQSIMLLIVFHHSHVLSHSILLIFILCSILGISCASRSCLLLSTCRKHIVLWRILHLTIISWSMLYIARRMRKKRKKTYHNLMRQILARNKIVHQICSKTYSSR